LFFLNNLYVNRLVDVFAILIYWNQVWYLLRHDDDDERKLNKSV